MYGFLIESSPLKEDKYQFFTYQGKSPVPVSYRGQDFRIVRGMKFGVRKSGNGRHIRLIFPENHTRVFTLDDSTASKLAKGCKSG